MKIKNLRINKLNKKTLGFLTFLSISLLSGCTKEETDDWSFLLNNVISNKNSCTHLTIVFNNEFITFKECDGYEISTYYNNNSDLEYSIYQDEKIILDGYTSMYNEYSIIHEDVDLLEKNKQLVK